MPQFFHGHARSARAALQRRLERERMGDEAYQKMIAHNDDRAFSLFGAVFILAFAAIVLWVAWIES